MVLLKFLQQIARYITVIKELHFYAQQEQLFFIGLCK
jgi:hypothetical protein